MKNLSLVLVIVFSSFRSIACLNEYYTTIDGQTAEATHSMGRYYRSFDTVYSQKFVDEYDLSKKEDYDFEDLSDVSIHLAKLKQYEVSLALLLWLVERHPDEYQLNANLGTLYELTGNVDSAYYFIEKSMQINPDSHMGTEWVHLSILKAKKELALNPNWLTTHRVLDLKLNQPTDVDSEENGVIIDTLAAVMYQMRERVPFTPVPDPILADIFDELGDWLAIHYSIEEAYIAYHIALEYGADARFKTQKELDKITSMLKESKAEIPDMNYHFPPADEFEKNRESNLSEDNEEENNSDNQTNEAEDKSLLWIWIALGGGIVLVILIVFLKRSSSK
jgi:tetratricopeptide (TPR) repeat protein